MGKGKRKGKGNEGDTGGGGGGGGGDQAPATQPGPSGSRQPPQGQAAQQPQKQFGQQKQHAQQPQQARAEQQPQQARPAQQPTPTQQLPNQIEMLVPGKKVGLVIGKGGETIKSLMAAHRVNMLIIQESRTAESGFKPLQISGDPKGVEEARRRVIELIGENVQTTSQGSQQGQQRPAEGQSQQQRPPPGFGRGQPVREPFPALGQQQRAPPGFGRSQPVEEPPQQYQRPAQGPPQQQQRPTQGPPQQQQRAPQGPPQQQQRPAQGPPQQQQRAPQGPPQREKASPTSSDKSVSSATSSVSSLSLGLPAGRKGSDYPALNGLIPPKRNDRPPMAKAGRKMTVETNHLPLSMVDTNLVAYHYDVNVDPERPFRFYRPALKLMQERFYPNNWPSFDGKKNIYSAKRLPFPGGIDTVSDTVTIFDEERAQPKEVTVTITLAAEVSLASIKEYLKSGCSTRPPQDAIQALDVALRQPAAHRFCQVGRSYFSEPKGRVIALGDGLNLWYGFFQSAILGARPYLNIDVAHKGFPAAVNCIEALKDFVRNGEVFPNQPVDEWAIRGLRGLIKGLKIIYTMPGSQQKRTHKVVDLGRSARDHRFEVRDRGEMTVEQYFRETYNYAIRYPFIPCLVCGSQLKPIALPAELCTIMPGQIVLKKLNEIQTRNMVRAAATPAPERRQKIIDAMHMVNFNADPHVKEFGLSVARDFKRVDARVLQAPKVEYSGKRIVPVAKGVWNSDKFIRPSSLENWVIYCCERRVRPNDLQNLERELGNVGRTLGMTVGRARIMNLKADNPRQVEQDFASFQKEKVQLLFVILPDRGQVTYAKIKHIAEINVGVLTQCLKSRTISKLSPATVTNILLKVNAKVNGINHYVDAACWPTFLERPVMVVGADVTHPSPDQQEIPSVAAVAASHDPSAFHYNMKWRLQQPREEMIQDLEQIMKDQLMFFYQRTGFKPEHILFYRDGVSEGQFKKVLDIELQAIRRACRSMGNDYEPPITFLVVQKRHHTRFFPTNDREADGKNKNVPAGTIVDTDIVHPTEFDFYLVSHASIQGTSRPTKYHVLWDDAKMPEQLLEEITYYLCHLFTRCTRSVSYPAPTYYAHLAAFRIRSYIENQDIRLRNLTQEEKNRTIKPNILNNCPMFFV